MRAVSQYTAQIDNTGRLAKDANASDTTTTQQVLIAVAEDMEKFTEVPETNRSPTTDWRNLLPTRVTTATTHSADLKEFKIRNYISGLSREGRN